MSRKSLALVVLALTGVTVATACIGSDSAVSEPVAMTPVERLPIQIQRSPKAVREAYQFAVANPVILKQVPCYCGCGGVGHTSVHSCYVAVDTPGEPIRYDGHALGCSICVDIALDALRLTREGMSPEMIRAYVDRNYGQFGTSNMWSGRAAPH
jgi:hypothetical protein